MAARRAPAAPPLPLDLPGDLAAVAAAAKTCTNCDLYKTATQTVFGSGARRARLVLVGEQPGDQEDREGAPFVGPAGEVLTRALAAAGLERRQIYLTNAVKHFKWEPRGKRRIHQTPRWSEIRACKPWLDAELQLLSPAVTVCLGAIAGKALFGSDFRLGVVRGQVLDGPEGRVTVATYHPSAVLRATAPEERERYFAALVTDLTLAASLAARPSSR